MTGAGWVRGWVMGAGRGGWVIGAGWVGDRCWVGVGDQCSVGMGKMGSQLNVTVSHRPFREALTPCALSLADTH